MMFFDKYPEFRGRALDRPDLTDPVSVLRAERPGRSVGGSIQTVP
jgi:hypothetical protein